MEKPKHKKSRLKKATTIAIFAKLAIIALLLCILIVPSISHKKYNISFHALKPIVVSFMKHYSNFK